MLPDVVRSDAGSRREPPIKIRLSRFVRHLFRK
jgi:hypothetical protein